MAEYRAPLTDLSFLLKYLIEADQLWPQLGIQDADPETVTAILGEAAKLCEQVVAPLNREGDEVGSHLKAGEVVVPDGFVEAYRAYCDGGWGALGGDPEFGGMGMPKSLVACVEEMLQGACMAFGLAPMLTAGACLALHAHGSQNLKQRFLPCLYSGQWAGAMDLTEPHAGTDLGLIRTKAVPLNTTRLEEPLYQLTGTKIFITWGEHSMAENIVHLVLAKLPDAPAGSKGISLFLVPKFLPNEDGSLGERNALHCGSLEKKMGIKASATCVMNFEGAKGWLVGEPHKGLAAMFTMMNYERLTVGIQAVAVAEASYQSAKDYALERLQSRSATGKKYPDGAADPIIVHPDVRRMLLHMRSFNEGSRAFYLYVAKYLDLAKFSDNAEHSKAAQGRVALLTPIAKAFMSDMALSAAVEGQQVFGGHGYIREWGQEQYVRDIRITQIYEGTNGIQALDLLGRKVIANKAVDLAAYCEEIAQFINQSLACVWRAEGAALAGAVETVLAVARELDARTQQNPDTIGDCAVDFLHLLGLISYGYLWLKMAASADAIQKESGADRERFGKDFLAAKAHVCRYFFHREFPRVDFLVQRIRAETSDVMAMSDNQF
ncbi:MAG TPA: acyl-CoA dehydrogenase C-terminal domain-containing protein [Marinagarivorans sp.]